MTALAATDSPLPAVDHGRASFVAATVVLWMSAMGAVLVAASWIGALSDPDYVLVLAVATVVGVWPAAVLSIVSIVIALHSRSRRRRVVFGLSTAALACHLPLVAALLVVQPFSHL